MLAMISQQKGTTSNIKIEKLLVNELFVYRRTGETMPLKGGGGRN
jgi:hypothetical protein